ncbi:hypothetical protein BDZ89DRAFT_1204039 [Hymenopellis radicata]|nr:hypothetical protein BDZ89DRAFT_1204039 [Hymenopellis radicata]
MGDGTAKCAVCGEILKIGAGGIKNLVKRHVGTGICGKNKEKKEKKAFDTKKYGKQSGLSAFLRPKAPPVPARVVAPAVINPLLPPATPVDSPVRIRPTPSAIVPQDTPRSVAVPPKAAALPKPPRVTMLLSDFKAIIDAVDMSTIPECEGDDPLAAFGHHPSTYMPNGIQGDELWEVGLNAIVHRVFGWGKTPEKIKGMIQGGILGVRNFYDFVQYFVTDRSVDIGLFKEKVDVLRDALDTFPKCSASPPPPVHSEIDDLEYVDNPVPQSSEPAAALHEIIDVDALSDVSEPTTFNHQQSSDNHCIGFQPTFPPGSSPHYDYPFALHSKLNLPWDYAVKRGVLTLRATGCRGKRDDAANSPLCARCRMLPINSILEGIMKRITEEGIHENTNLGYFSHRQLVDRHHRQNQQLNALKLKGLNNSKLLHGRARALSNHKRLLVAIRSGRVEGVDRIIRVGLKRGLGVKGLLALYERAAMGAYCPQPYEESDYLRGLLLWRLGGNRVAKIAHRSLHQIPSLSTLRCNSTMPRIRPSYGAPTEIEVKSNIEAVLSPEELTASRKSGDVCHQVVMFDEISVDKRIRWDDLTNYFLGLCREHGDRVSLEFNGVDEMKELFRSLDCGDVHYSSEATIGALGILIDNTRIYGARPILVSGTCKCETSAEHARVLQTVLDAVDSTKDETKLCVVSIASDGETKRGGALIDMTFKDDLSPSSPIYPLLHPLEFMDFHVGDDDLTADKDYKHVFKRLCNLMLRRCGLDVRETHVNPMIMQSHLCDAGGSKEHIDSLFKPDDKQDVTLAYQLMRDLWSLPETTSDQPIFVAQRNALRLLGSLFRHLIFPYICVDLTLSKQLRHLSAAAHLALALFRESGKDFIPTLLYTDIMIMIKNVYFCVAKGKIDNPSGMFWIILLGTDRLETLFGILRTIVGTDANVDLLQLATRLTGTNEVSNILAMKPEWDSSPRRLQLPAVTKEGHQILDSGVDRINPRSWRADVSLSNVVLQTCWRGGRRMVEDNNPELAPLFAALDRDKRSISILSPCGVLLMDLPLAEDDNEDPDVPDASDVPDVPRLDMDDSGVWELEDQIAEDEDVVVSDVTKRVFDRFVLMDGKKVNKARAIKIHSRYRNEISSTDRLKRVQEIKRFSFDRSCVALNSIDDDFEDTMQPVLIIGEPVATLLYCEHQLFVCIGAVTDITIGGSKDSSVTDVG